MNLPMLLRDLFVCLVAVFCFGIFMSVPIRPLIVASVGSAISYVVYRVLTLTVSDLLGFLAASFLIALWAEIMARVLKKPASIFVLPGIIPLVPGVGLYQTMLCLVRNDMEGFQTEGIHTLFISLIIGATVAVVSGAIRLLPRPAPKPPRTSA